MNEPAVSLLATVGASDRVTTSHVIRISRETYNRLQLAKQDSKQSINGVIKGLLDKEAGDIDAGPDRQQPVD